MRPETLSLLTHREDLTVLGRGKADRQEPPSASLAQSLTGGPGGAVSALPYCQNPFPASASWTRHREVSRDQEKLIAEISTILVPNLLGQSPRKPPVLAGS